MTSDELVSQYRRALASFAAVESESSRPALACGMIA
jgi:hypothetical protein